MFVFLNVYLKLYRIMYFSLIMTRRICLPISNLLLWC